MPQYSDSFVATIRRRNDNINIGFKETGWDDVNWIRLASGFGICGGIRVLNLQASHKEWDGLSRQATIGLLRIMLLPSS